MSVSKYIIDDITPPSQKEGGGEAVVVYNELNDFADALKSVSKDKLAPVIFEFDSTSSLDTTFDVIKYSFMLYSHVNRSERAELFSVELYKTDHQEKFFTTPFPIKPGGYVVPFEDVTQLHTIIQDHVKHPAWKQIIFRLTTPTSD